MIKSAIRFPFAFLSLTLAITTAYGQSNLSAKANSYQPQPQPSVDANGNESDRARDGLLGPVRRVRTEVAKISNVSGRTVEDTKRNLLETAEYDLKGVKTQNQYFPIAGVTLTGREVYKYDDRGNISEMTLVNADGTLLSKEVYKYDYDSVGNWIKMTTSVVVVENGKLSFEPTEATYRSIFYYLDASMTKMLESASGSNPASANSDANLKDPKSSAASLPPTISLDKLKEPSVQPVSTDLQGTNVDANKRLMIAENDSAPVRPKPLLRPISGGVLNGKAISLPAPAYPDVALRTRTEGTVQVELIVDENGKVISVTAVSGPAMLREAATQAAYRARFSPTKLSGQSVKVSGLINYNFTLPK